MDDTSNPFMLCCLKTKHSINDLINHQSFLFFLAGTFFSGTMMHSYFDQWSSFVPKVTLSRPKE